MHPYRCYDHTVIVTLASSLVHAALLIVIVFSFAVIFESGPAADCSTVDGPGKGFSLPGDTDAALAQNVVLVRCNDVNGEPAGLTSTDDVELAFTCALQPAGSGAAVGAVVAKSMKGSGLVEIVYTITAATDISGIRACVSVCGSTSTGLCWDVRRYSGCVRLPADNFFHIAISPDNSTLAVSAFERSEIQLFDLKSNTVIRSLTASRRQGGLARRWPAEPGGDAGFVHPFRMCFTPSGTLLVATETSNREISEITVTGDELRVIKCSVPADEDTTGEPAPYCVDCDDGLGVCGRVRTCFCVCLHVCV